VDFGIAVRAGSEDLLSHPFQVIGTPAYMAPERLTGEAVSAPADVYALGVLLYRLLAGRYPWPVESTLQMLTAHVSDHPAPMPPRAGIPALVTALGSRCLAKNPASRPSAREAEAVLTSGALNSAEAGTAAACDDAGYLGPGVSPVTRARSLERDTAGPRTALHNTIDLSGQADRVPSIWNRTTAAWD
jgi:serine/threonine-protein kinase